ncbi:hypothetical protein ACRYCC_31435 [Actinomadura scrupuli]|uniref:hypothetical protein n=1 Tax=Actinomadura scrupuli TaxID=559629 RepID=UPI003D97B69A
MTNKSIMTAYWNEVRAGFNRLPVWFPGATMELGDVGVLEPGGWAKHTSLTELGVPYRADAQGVPSNIEYASEGGVEVTAGTGHVGVDLAQVAGRGHLTYKFHRAGAFVWRASGVTTRRIADLAAVDGAVLDLYGAGTWRREWVLVTEVVVGGPVLVLVAADKGTEVDVGVRADVQAAERTVGAAPQVVVGFRGSLASRVDTEEPTAVMWRGRRVADRLLRQARMVDQSRVGPPEEAGDEATMMDVEALSDLPAGPPDGTG